MSLLINESYANQGKALWVSSTGGTVEGGLTVDGNLVVDGDMSATQIFTQQLNLTDSAGVTHADILATNATNTYFQSDGSILFTQRGSGTANTSLEISAPGSGLDHFYTNFLSAVGPLPSASIVNGNPQVVSLPSGSTFRTGVFAVTTPYAVLPNAEYDVQAKGFFTLSALPAPVSGDFLSISVSTGAGANSTVAVILNPADFFPKLTIVNETIAFNVRGRIIAPASPSATLTATASFNGNIATGTITATCTLLDVVRVA